MVKNQLTIFNIVTAYELGPDPSEPNFQYQNNTETTRKGESPRYPMNSSIDLTDFYSLLAVWELQEHSWELIIITRLRCAIASCREQSSRLVFPTRTRPNRVWEGVCSKHTPQQQVEQLPLSVSNTERVMEAVKTCPGLSTAFLAKQIGISKTAVGRHLQQLEKEGNVHYRPDPLDQRIRLYYPGSKPPHTSSSATLRTRKIVLPKRREPPLKVYFVDPRTL